MRVTVSSVWLAGAALFAMIALPARAATCGNLGSLALRDGTINAAEEVAAGAFTPPQGPAPAAAFRNLPAFCRIQATLRPGPDSHIDTEVWMPVSGWNGKLQSVGNGAWAGSISYPAMATGLAAGYAAASTDTGHKGNRGDFV